MVPLVGTWFPARGRGDHLNWNVHYEVVCDVLLTNVNNSYIYRGTGGLRGMFNILHYSMFHILHFSGISYHVR
jgi:hypothetical protein